MQKTNESYTLEMTTPLKRAGLKLIVGPFSKGYAVDVMCDAMEIVREFNKRQTEKKDTPKA